VIVLDVRVAGEGRRLTWDVGSQLGGWLGRWGSVLGGVNASLILAGQTSGLIVMGGLV
jgi:hypothetical protein